MKNGPFSAAVLAAGIGTAAMGIVTTAAEASEAFGRALAWSKPVGALSGKNVIAVAVRLVAWLTLGLTWKNREIRYAPVLVISAVLLVMGLLFTFPPIFDLIAGG